MFRGAAIGFVASMLLTAVATLMSTGAVHAQQGPQHVFSGYVSNHRQPLNEGFVRVFIGQAHEVASGDIRQGRYKLAVVQPAGDYFSGRTLRFVVVYQGIEYERPGQIGWQAGKTNEENFDIEGWQWRQGQPQRLPNQPQNDGGMNAKARMEMERERMEMESERQREEDEERRQMQREREERDQERQREREDRDAEMRQDEQQSRRGMEEDMRREQMEMERERMERESEMREKEGEERREMEREQMERETDMREKEGEERREMERERMEREEEMRREQMESEAEMRQEQMELDRQRMGRGQPGVQPGGGERSQSGPSRGLFSNRAAGEATSGIDNIMDPTMLTIIGIALTVLTTGMTLFKGD